MDSNKPKLIDTDFFKKVNNNINKKRTDMVSSRVGNVIRTYFLNFIVNYSDMIIVLLILSTMLYFRYKYILGEKNKKKKPVVLEVNYHRSNDYADGSLINTTDNIETSQEVNDDILDVIKNKVNDFEYELQPAEMSNFNEYESI